MPADRFQTVMRVVEGALERQGEARERYLGQACAGDLALRAEVESLLALDSTTASLEPPDPSALARAVARSGSAVQVGAWRLEREIGSGGMGTVYLAWREEAGFRQRGALKLVRPGFASTELVRRFARERAVLASLEHEHIARLLDGGASAEGTPYLVMEYVEGEPIDRWCAAHGLSVRARIELFLAVCGAVSYAHQKLVVHRDLKPSNILVTAEGVPKLLDFGIAKVLSAERDGGDATRTQERRLTPAYASPEQLRGEEVTTASDVYALGVVLYELVSGAHPLTSLGAGQAPSGALLDREVARPSTAARRAGSHRAERALRGDVDTIALKALAPEVARRYASVEAFGADLRRWLDGLPVLARPDTRFYRMRRFARRNAAWVGAGVAVFLALVAGLVVSSYQYFEAREARDAEAVQVTLAQERLQTVLKMAATLTNDVSTALGSIPGASATREQIVRKVVAALDELAGEKAIDPDLGYELGWGYHQLSLALGSPYGPSLGEHEEACEMAARGDALLARMQAEHPEQVRFPHLRSELANDVAMVRLFQRRLSEGLDAADRAVALAREAVEGAAASERGAELQQLAASLQRRADLLAELGEFRAAVRDREECVACSEGSLDVAPDVPQSRYQLACAFLSLASSELQSGRADAAVAAFAEGTAVLEELARDHPEIQVTQNALNVARMNSVDAFLALDDLESARARLEAGRAYFEGWAAAEPGNEAAQAAFLQALGTGASLAMASMDWQEAGACWSVLLEHCRRWQERFPSSRSFQDSLLDSLAQLALTRAHEERYEEALGVVLEADSLCASTRTLEIGARTADVWSARYERAIGECLLLAAEKGPGSEEERRELAGEAGRHFERCDGIRRALVEQGTLPALDSTFAGLDELSERARAVGGD